MHIAILGSGYVGLVCGAGLADFGHRVICVDRDATKIERLRGGQIPIFEPGLAALIACNLAAGRLSFSTDIEEAVAAAQVVFIAVGTPSRHDDGAADLSCVFEAAETIGSAMQGFTVIAVKSTVPVGTGDQVERIIAQAGGDSDFAVVSNPEFLREGAAIADFMRPDRVVIGAEDGRASNIMADLYRNLGPAVPILHVSRRTSELIKYASNGILALKLAFTNEIADLCEAMGADMRGVVRGMGLDHRIGVDFLNPGPGFGGSCLPKDLRALMKTARDAASPALLVEAALTANDRRKRAMTHKVVTACGGSVRGRKIAVLGLTFKPGTDDLRESPAIAIIRALQAGGARIAAYDPQGMAAAAQLLANVDFGEDAYVIAAGADAVVIATGWDEFRALDFARLGTRMTRRILLDLCNICNADAAARHGFQCHAIGRADVMPAQEIMQAAE